MNKDDLSKDRDKINKAKRAWRARNPRIDYYPSNIALTVINGKYERYGPCNNNSGILDTIVREWAEDRKLIEKNRKTHESGKVPEFRDLYAHARNDFGVSLIKRIVILESNRQVVCGARTQSGQPCRAKSLPNKKRCKWHGGCSTGPKTNEGKTRALANLRQNRKSVHC